MKKIIKKKINIPLTPNFIKVGNDTENDMLPIADFTDRELAEIGRRWTNELIEKANKRRKK